MWGGPWLAQECRGFADVREAARNGRPGRALAAGSGVDRPGRAARRPAGLRPCGGPPTARFPDPGPPRGPSRAGMQPAGSAPGPGQCERRNHPVGAGTPGDRLQGRCRREDAAPARAHRPRGAGPAPQCSRDGGVAPRTRRVQGQGARRREGWGARGLEDCDDGGRGARLAGCGARR